MDGAVFRLDNDFNAAVKPRRCTVPFSSSFSIQPLGNNARDEWWFHAYSSVFRRHCQPNVSNVPPRQPTVFLSFKYSLSPINAARMSTLVMLMRGLRLTPATVKKRISSCSLWAMMPAMNGGFHVKSSGSGEGRSANSNLGAKRQRHCIHSLVRLCSAVWAERGRRKGEVP